MTSLIVTDGEQRASLAVVRSLGRRGHRVIVASHRPHPLAGASRWSSATLVVPDPLQDPVGAAEAVASTAEREGVDTVVPVTEASWLALFPVRDRGLRLPGPSSEAFSAVRDKRRLLEVASRIGIAVPRQVVLETPGCLPADPAPFPFPLYVKPTRSVAGPPGCRKQFGVEVADSAATLPDVVARYPAEAYPLLLQEGTRGHGAGVFLLVWEGELVAAFAHRRLRELPPGGGVSVLRESRPVDPAVVHASLRLLKAFDWSGVAMVEYRVDALTGVPVLMEVNGRFWGSLQLAVDAGVDFPALLLELAEGRRPAPSAPFRTGVRSRWLWGDVDHLYARLRRRDVRGAVSAAWGLLSSFRPGTRSEILRMDDPWPFFRETAQWFRPS